MNYFRANPHIGRSPKQTGRYRYFTTASIDLCHPEGTYIIRDAKDPNHKLVRSNDRPYLKRFVRILNKAGESPT